LPLVFRSLLIVRGKLSDLRKLKSAPIVQISQTSTRRLPLGVADVLHGTEVTREARHIYAFGTSCCSNQFSFVSHTTPDHNSLFGVITQRLRRAPALHGSRPLPAVNPLSGW
jgi:hypothetical protein